MPDKRRHRGAGPEDGKLFAAVEQVNLRLAVGDYSLLLGKGYAQKSSLKLVGDHFSLTERQRMAVMRSSCSDSQLEARAGRRVEVSGLKGKSIVIDGYNILITIEAALGSACVFIGRDGCMRDLSGLHGSYRRVSETLPAFELIARGLEGVGAKSAVWLFDRPVSNSGRLKTMIGELAEENDWPWEGEVLANPDVELIAADEIIATSDSDVLDKCGQWVNLAGALIERYIAPAHIVDLSKSS